MCSNKDIQPHQTSFQKIVLKVPVRRTRQKRGEVSPTIRDQLEVPDGFLDTTTLSVFHLTDKPLEVHDVLGTGHVTSGNLQLPRRH